MAPGRRRGAKGVKPKNELSLGDLVLAKVKGFPAWPAKISRPEDWQRAPDPKKYFVQFFGTSEIAFIAPADIQAFTHEAKTKLSARCLGKTVKYFAQAVKEICEEFEELQRKDVSGERGDNCVQTHPSEAHSVFPVVDEALDVNQNNGIVPDWKSETKESDDLCSGIEHCPHKKDEVEFQDVNKISAKHKNVVKDSLSVSSPSLHSPRKEDPLDIKVKGRYSDGSENELTNGHRTKPEMGSNKKSQAEVLRSGGSAFPHNHSAEVIRRKFASRGSTKFSSPDIPKLCAEVSSQKREKGFVEDKRHSKAPGDGQESTKVEYELSKDSISWKNLKVQHGREKLGSQTNVASSPAKILKTTDTANDTNLIKTPINRKSDSRSLNVLDGEMANREPKRFTSVGKDEVRRSIRLPIINSEPNHSSDEDDLPPIKRHRRESETVLISSLMPENSSRTSVTHKTDLVHPSKIQSPVVQLPIKRRSVRTYVDDDELPKTPIHGGHLGKVSVIQRVADSKRKSAIHGESYACDPHVLRRSGKVNNGLKESVQPISGMNKLLSPAAQLGMEKTTRESSAAIVSFSPRDLDSEKLAPVEVIPVSVSPKMFPRSVGGGRLSGELESKQSNRAPGIDFRKRTPAGDNKNAASSDATNIIHNLSISEKSKQPFYVEKKKTIPKWDSRISDSVDGTLNENVVPFCERVSASKDIKASHVVDSKTSDSATSMKHLIAAAQARKKQAHIQNSYGNPFLFSIPDLDMPGRGRSPAPAALACEASNTLQLDVLGSHPTSPCANVHQMPSNNQHENDEFEERRLSSGHQGTGSSLSGSTEAAVARDAFEGMIETLSRTKESIARATRLAIDCAKHGRAFEVVELLIQKLENEPSLHRRVDLFFLVDSITQCSHTQRGASYVSTVQAVLPRLIGAAAPAGAGAQENRRQCRKVLRLWLERKILPESVLQRYMDDLGAVNDDTSIPLRRPSRSERAFDDPIREMEGMVVDEYGSNAMFQLPGLLLANGFEEEEDDDASDTNLCTRDNVDKSPSNHTPVTGRGPENHCVTPSDRRHCILEEVDVELEMEDVSEHQKDGRLLNANGSVELGSLELNPDGMLESSINISSESFSSPVGSPPLPPGSPPVTPPLPTSPPPSSPVPPPPPSSPPPLPPPPTSHQHPFSPPVGPPQPPVGPPPHVGPTPPVGPPLGPAGPSPPVGPPPSHLHHPPQPLGPHLPTFAGTPHMGPPIPISQQSFPSLSPMVSQNKTPLPSLPYSPRSSYRPHPLPHEVGVTPTGIQPTLMVPTTHGSDASVRGEILPQQSSCFPPSGVSIAREHVGYNSSRHTEYGEDVVYMNPLTSQHRQPYLTGSVPFAQRPVHSELPSQHLPGHYPYPNSTQQHQYPSYSMSNLTDGSRRYIAEEQWRTQGNEFNGDHQHGWMPGGRSHSGPSYSHEGYHERPSTSTVTFQNSAPNLSSQMPAHGVPMMASRPNMPAINWRPA